MSIPKVIHYCWFGRNPLPESAKKCIESWKNYLPDYTIKEWNEDNFNIQCCDYVKEAYNAKKYAFVSDYARFDILYREGGIYFDVDVEVIKPFDDLLSKGGFMGFEAEDKNNLEKYFVNPGLALAISSNHEIFKDLLEGYHTRHFLKSDGSYDLTTICSYTTQVLVKNGMKNDGNLQNVKGIWIYPPDYFCPMNFYSGETIITINTHSIHHYSNTWHTSKEQKWHQRMQKKRSVMGEEKFIKYQNSLFIRLYANIYCYGIQGLIKKILSKHK